MAIRLITGRLQQWSNVCKNNFTKKDSMRYTKLEKDVCLSNSNTLPNMYHRHPSLEICCNRTKNNLPQPCVDGVHSHTRCIRDQYPSGTLCQQLQEGKVQAPRKIPFLSFMVTEIQEDRPEVLPKVRTRHHED